jgi:hypothetical protein
MLTWLVCMAEHAIAKSTVFRHNAVTMFKEILEYLWQNKLWWLLPPVIVFIIFGALVLFSTASPVSPFVYVLL